jgi:cupin fold WbuC family metalloprotein
MLRLDPTKFKRDLTAHSVAFFAIDQTVTVDDHMIDALIIESQAACNRPARICLHTMPDADFHEMVVLERPGHYFPPHRHVFKAESLHVIEGQLAVFTFDDRGGVLTATVLGRDGNLIARVGANIWHLTLPVTDPVIYHESKPGPFLGMRDRDFAPWAPRRTARITWDDYCAGLLDKVAA